MTERSSQATEDCVEAAMESESWSFAVKRVNGERTVRTAEDFQGAMERIQWRLLHCHLGQMDRETWARASRTLQYLEGKITAEQALRPGLAQGEV